MPGTLVRTSDSDAARELCAQVYFPHRLTVLHDPARFAMSLSAFSLGPVAVGLGRPGSYRGPLLCLRPWSCSRLDSSTPSERMMAARVSAGSITASM